MTENHTISGTSSKSKVQYLVSFHLLFYRQARNDYMYVEHFNISAYECLIFVLLSFSVCVQPHMPFSLQILMSIELV